MNSTRNSRTFQEYTFVQNSYANDELYTAAKASSIGSTDKRSQISSDSVRKRDYMAITQPTMNQTIFPVAMSGGAHSSSNGHETVVNDNSEARPSPFLTATIEENEMRKSSRRRELKTKET